MDRLEVRPYSFALPPTTCAFSRMDRRMDRDGSAWILLITLPRNHTGDHDLCVFTDGSADGSGWIGLKSVRTHLHSHPRFVHIHGWIGGWIVLFALLRNRTGAHYLCTLTDGSVDAS
jgi:hypothetical protein